MNHSQIDSKKTVGDIKLLALDFDGTLTDGTVYVDQNGVESIRCSRKDSLGTNMLQAVGVYVCVISKEPNPVVSTRCKKMRLPCEQSVETGDGKREILERIAREQGLTPKQVAFMGDDVNDIPAMEFASVSFAPEDAHPLVKERATHVVSKPGGNGAVREVCELILTAKGISIAV